MRLWAWVPVGTEVHSHSGVTTAKKNYRVKVYRLYDVGPHLHLPNEPCDETCVRAPNAHVAWVNGGARWCQAKLDLIDETDPRWFR